MKITDCFQLGYIVKPHGLKGEFTIFLDSDHPEYYKGLESVYVEFQHKLVPFFIDHIEIAGNKATVKLQDIDGIEDANQYKGCILYLPLDRLPELREDQFYYHEIIGFQVSDSVNGHLGEVTSVYEANGNDLLAIDYNGNEVLVPVREEFIIDLDKKNKSIILNLPDGLLDIYL
jgi:16S rRNA processing protein RimM